MIRMHQIQPILQRLDQPVAGGDHVAGDVVEAAVAVLIHTEMPPMGMDPTHRQNKGHGLSFQKNLMAPSMHLL